MKTKTKEPIPLVVIEHENDISTKIFMLDEDDAFAMNTSTNYNHHYNGPSLIFLEEGRGQQSSEHYVNDFEAWEYIDTMMQLGVKYLEENPDFNMIEFREEMQNRRAKYLDMKHKSIHK